MVGRRDTDRACHRPQFESNLRHDRVSLPLVAPPLRKAEPSARVFLHAIYPAVDTSTRPVFRPTFSRLRVHPSHPAEHAVEKPGRGWSSLRKNEDPEGTESRGFGLCSEYTRIYYVGSYGDIGISGQM